MPISYDSFSGGMMKEHQLVRQHAGIFDVSHMGEFLISGSGAAAFLNYALTRPVDSLAEGRAQYALLLNSQGMILDDVIVYKLAADRFWLVVNASNRLKDWNHLQTFASKFQVTLTDVSDDTALIAVQGPEAVGVVNRLYSGSEGLKYYGFMGVPEKAIVARTGYTGEDGFEVFLPAKDAMSLWQRLLNEGVKPIGLGARDTLRLEVGFPLYGHELTEELRPQETWAQFAVAKEPQCLGAQALTLPARYRPVAVSTDNPKPIREGDSLWVDDLQVGWITSGSTSPMIRKGMALGLLRLDALQKLSEKPEVFMLESAGKRRQSFVQSLPFVATPRVKAAKAKVV
jgi:aminomethyltransferase